MNEKISIIIPAYNASKYITRTLYSICNQTYKNLEIIVVDDGSSDNTLEICKKQSEKDNRIKVFHKKNQGVTLARDMGISMATGELIGFVDADDTIDPEMYECLYNNLVKYDADISHCGYKTIKENGEENLFYGTGKLIIQSNTDGIIDLIKGEIIEPSLCIKLFRKELFDNLDYDKTMRINEDYVMNLLLFKKSRKSVFVDEPYYHYYQNENSGSSKNTEEYFYRDILKAADITLNLFKYDDNIHYYAEKRWFKTYSSMYKNQHSCNFKKVKFDLKSLLYNVRNKILDNFRMFKNNPLFNFSDKFILYLMKFCPKLLVIIDSLR